MEIRDITAPTDPTYLRVIVAEESGADSLVTVTGYRRKSGQIAFSVSQHGNPKKANLKIIFSMIKSVNAKLEEARHEN